MFERFTDSARRVLVLAQEECRLRCHHEIGTEHLLLALLHDHTNELAMALAGAGVTKEAVQVRRRGRRTSSGFVPFTANAKHALEQSLLECERLGHELVAPAHLLLAILHAEAGRAFQILRGLNVEPESLATLAEDVANRGG